MEPDDPMIDPLLLEAQHELLAFYKRAPGNKSDYPPLRYQIDCLRVPPRRGRAPDIAAIRNMPLLKATVQLYLAREEARLGRPGHEKLFAAGKETILRIGDTFAGAVVGVIEKEILSLRKA